MAGEDRGGLGRRAEQVERGGLAVVLAITSVTLAFAFLQKSPCIRGDWFGELVQYSKFCYTDIIPLYHGQVADRVPYFDPCPGDVCDEYPPGTMATMWTLAQPVTSSEGFFFINAIFLSACALLTAYALVRATGRRAFYFAAAPAVIVYGFLNWDLLAIALSVSAVWMYLERRHVPAGILLGLGTATKLFPVLFLIGMGLDLIRKKEWPRLANLAGGASIAWLVVNLPLIVYAREGWMRFFRFNSERYYSFESTWAVVCDRLLGGNCTPEQLNVWSLGAFILGTVAVCVLALRDGRGELWKLGFPIFILFLLTNKVYSPQYSLWMAPWFALALPSVPLFIVFSVVDLAVFFGVFSFLGTLDGLAGFTSDALHLFVVIRALVLIGLIVAFFRRRQKATTELAPVTAP